MLILALDVVSFYAGFALMTFAAYGLVIHTGKPEARRAGRVYLAMAVLGEGLILAGLLLAVVQADVGIQPLLADLPAAVATSDQRDLLIALLWLGFGVKAGLPLLHLWLPLAHPVAPVPASAVLSGAMIKAGLLGWLHTLPIGLVSLPGWSALVIVAGLVAAFGAAFLSLHQEHPKTVLAYSSISQMGLITVGVGMALQEPDLRPLLVAAIAVYALHHGLSKGALFLGVGIARHPGRLAGPLLWLLLALPALSLAGVMTSGVVAKLGLKAALHTQAVLPDWWDHLPRLLELAAVGTTLIMARYLWLLRSESQGDRAPAAAWWGWVLLLASGPALVFLPGHWGLVDRDAITPGDWVSLSWPVLLGTALALIGARTLRPWPIPPGDLLALITPRPQTVTRIRARRRARSTSCWDGSIRRASWRAIARATSSAPTGSGNARWHWPTPRCWCFCWRPPCCERKGRGQPHGCGKERTGTATRLRTEKRRRYNTRWIFAAAMDPPSGTPWRTSTSAAGPPRNWTICPRRIAGCSTSSPIGTRAFRTTWATG
jgi:hydrogenase-4 component B